MVKHFILSCFWVSSAVAIAQSGNYEGAVQETHLGGCILREPVRDAPYDPYYKTLVIRTAEFPPQTKKLEVYGITLAGNDDITDTFMLDVAKTIQEMFPKDPGLDNEKQAEVLSLMHQYRALIPMYDSEVGFLLTDDEEDAWQKTEATCSVCDVIFKIDTLQVQEVVEHILHFVTDIGLHYAFPEEWGIRADSEVNRFMNMAIEKGYYDVSQYLEERDAFGDEEGMRRVLIQEFSYWVITTAWNFQEPYGPDAEWHIVNRLDLKDKMPGLFDMYARTVETIMAPPKLDTLDKFPDAPVEARK